MFHIAPQVFYRSLISEALNGFAGCGMVFILASVPQLSILAQKIVVFVDAVYHLAPAMTEHNLLPFSFSPLQRLHLRADPRSYDP